MLSQIKERIIELILPLKIKHVFGKTKIDYGKNELIAVCLVHNSELCIKDYIGYYLSLGVKHIFFLDNNSIDRTIERARGYKNVTMLKTKAPVRNDEEECRLKKYLARRFGRRDRWCLVADADEFFDYPHSDAVSLGSLLDYLNMNKYTAVVTQMLDMFSDKPLNKLANNESLKEFYSYYDIFDIHKKDYFEIMNERNFKKNILSNKDIKFYTGGIRKTVFNTDNWLTKHALIFLNNRIDILPHSHFSGNARIADFSAVLYHYKFHNDFYNSSLRCVRKGLFPACLHEYESYVKMLDKNPSITLKRKTSKRLKSVNDLIKNGFLAVSENYRRYAGEMKK